MLRTLVFVSFLGALIAGCASAPYVPLDQIKTRRVYQGTKQDIMNAARVFATREMFKIQSFEEETGRIAGYKSVSFPRSDDPRTIVMQVSIVPESQGKWDVSAVFRYSQAGEQLTRGEESLLAECYSSFFTQIEQVAL